MKFSDRGRQLLKVWEGSQSEVYPDSRGLPTVGVGHLLSHDELMSGKIWINGQPVQYAGGLTDENISNLLAQDLGKFERTIEANVVVPLTQDQFDCLVSFCFNVGADAFRNSTLLKLLNTGDYGSVPFQMRRWVYCRGVEVAGLRNRRELEINSMWEA